MPAEKNERNIGRSYRDKYVISKGIEKRGSALQREKLVRSILLKIKSNIFLAHKIIQFSHCSRLRNNVIYFRVLYPARLTVSDKRVSFGELARRLTKRNNESPGNPLPRLLL